MGKARGKSKHFRCERQKVTARTVIFDDSPAPKRSVTRVPIPFDSTHTLPQHPCPSTAAAAVDTLFPSQDEPELAPPQTRTTYSKQKIATQESWNNVRDDLFNTSVEMAVPISYTCTICRMEEECLIFRCRECGPAAMFCIECLRKQHEKLNSFHMPDKNMSKVTRHGEVWTASTSKAEAFLNDKVPQVDTQFCLAMSGPSTSSKASKKDEAKGLRKEAQAMLNAISSSHPELKSKFPYKLLEEGKVVVEGLPEDFKFRKPSDMGVDDLKVLLNYRNSLVIHVQPESTMLSSSSTDASVAGPSRVSPMLMETGTGGPEVVEETTIPEGTECMQQLQSIQAGIEEAPPTEVELISSQEKETERQRERKKGRGKAKGKGKRKREEEGPYFVEKLVGKRMQGGEVQYHVKWQGWPDSANTWEPTSNIHPDTIEIFYPSN
ncbi:La ribonucleoprotein [Branchiostoma belcheri]|nr:La ribonucleoprotein [Branchiostoma belcheri]